MEHWFTSYTHFGHTNIIKYCGRPFANAEEMNEELIARWNARVEPGDIVHHLGDFALGVQDKLHYAQTIRRRLHGDIDFYMGNHDPGAPNNLSILQAAGIFQKVSHYGEIFVNKQAIVLSHYSQRTWHHDTKGTWHLFGHTHGTLAAYGKSVDVGVDTWDFKPVHFDELKKFMDAREIGDHPKFEHFQGSGDTCASVKQSSLAAN